MSKIKRNSHFIIFAVLFLTLCIVSVNYYISPAYAISCGTDGCKCSCSGVGCECVAQGGVGCACGCTVGTSSWCDVEAQQ
jgi:hypothetical protein